MVRHPSGSREDGREQDPIGQQNPERRAKDTGTHKGLCVNCANRENCLYPKSEAGVWHCEQYVEEQ